MSKRIKVTDLPDFDAAPYLDSEEAIAAYLTEILTATILPCLPPLWVTSPGREA